MLVRRRIFIFLFQVFSSDNIPEEFEEETHRLRFRPNNGIERDESDYNEDYNEATTSSDGTSTYTTTTSTPTTEEPKTAQEGKQLCEKYPDTLIGRILPDTALDIEWDAVKAAVEPGLLDGGCWEPTDCIPRVKTAIIVPYKDREEHLKRLLYYLHPFLQRQQIGYCIFVAEQYHDGRFNKGNPSSRSF